MTKTTDSKQTTLLLESIIEGIQDVKGHDITVLDLTKIPHSVASHFVVCHGNSNTQVTAIARGVEKQTSIALNEKPWSREGIGNAEWALLDYGNIVVHVFYKEARAFYALEELWADAELTHYEDVE
ncbi:MAG: ribosome silencing factor [Flavobacteriales bacterium]|nr:ribosome silencing factor [Flavobacteriales bacterium]MDG1766674.1 ribosome silencing factor [Flavobacteriales bacterium]